MYFLMAYAVSLVYEHIFGKSDVYLGGPIYLKPLR
jgi:hypothetical protein